MAGSLRLVRPVSPTAEFERLHMFSNDRVLFDRPDLVRLNQTHTVVDLHFHSHYSDGLNSITKIAQRARNLGIGIAITDHNEIRGALEMDQHEDIFSIPGIEITSAEGSHLLVYFDTTEQLQKFYSRHVVPFMGHGVMSSLGLSMEQIILRARDYECLIIFAHPYCALYTGICNLHFSPEQLERLFQMVDGVEAINANNLKRWNLKCTVLGFNLGKAMVGGSDGHALNHMGRSVTYAQTPRNRQDFLNALRLQANKVMGKEITLLRKVTSNGLKLRSNLNNCPDLMEKHFRYSCKVINFKSRAIRSNVKRRLNARFNSTTLRSYFGM
jgi:predicted metal-dependent phosphoesterase TrpH